MQAIGNNVGALEMHNKCQAIREKLLCKEHFLTLQCHYNIGALMNMMGDNVGALGILNKGLVIYYILSRERQTWTCKTSS